MKNINKLATSAITAQRCDFSTSNAAAQYYYHSVLQLLSTTTAQYYYHSVLLPLSTMTGQYYDYQVLPSTTITTPQYDLPALLHSATAHYYDYPSLRPRTTQSTNITIFAFCFTTFLIEYQL